MDKRTFPISVEDVGKRVDKFLAEQMPDHSRAVIQKMEKTNKQ